MKKAALVGIACFLLGATAVSVAQLTQAQIDKSAQEARALLADENEQHRRTMAALCERFVAAKGDQAIEQASVRAFKASQYPGTDRIKAQAQFAAANTEESVLRVLRVVACGRITGPSPSSPSRPNHQ